jgi:hypothetical protein
MYTLHSRHENKEFAFAHPAVYDYLCCLVARGKDGVDENILEKEKDRMR